MKGKVLKGLEVTGVADDGKAVCRHEGFVIFIDDAVPGDIVDVLIRRKKNSYAEASVVEYIRFSDKRLQPFCSHFGKCGGCKWQHMDYIHQLYYKQLAVSDSMSRIAKLENPEIRPIIPSPEIKYYRNKLDFSFSDRKWLSPEQFSEKEKFDGPALGFHIPGRYDKVLDIETCYLQPDLSNEIRNCIKAYTINNNIPYINLRSQTGVMRSVIMRNTLAGDWMVIVMFKEDDPAVRNDLLLMLQSTFPQIKALLYVINPKQNDTFYDLPVHVYYGDDHITEEIDGLKFRIGAKSFFQTNSRQAQTLYRKTFEYAGLKGDELVYDLYTGTGTIALYMARKAGKVIGIESVIEAIDDAKLNATLNGINNVEFYSGDMKDMLTVSFFNEHGKPDVVITDPPRAGMHEDVVMQLLEAEVKRIVYVSCNAATQARDLLLLKEKYSVDILQPVDMFPHTSHVENIALLNLY